MLCFSRYGGALVGVKRPRVSTSLVNNERGRYRTVDNGINENLYHRNTLPYTVLIANCVEVTYMLYVFLCNVYLFTHVIHRYSTCNLGCVAYISNTAHKVI